MATLIVAVLVASLLGSLHCGGMCGPLVAFVMGGGPGGADRWRLHLAYHGGRLFMYAFLGAVAGAVGAALDKGGALVGVQRLAALLAGFTMVVFGLLAVLHQVGARALRLSPPVALSRSLAWGRALALRTSPLTRATVFGVLTAFLPCGWLWAFVVAAAGTGHPLAGGATLVAFWIGTVPVLAVVGIGVQSLRGATRQAVQVAASLLIVALGVVTVFERSTPAEILSAGRRPDTVEEAVRHVHSLEASGAPCCDHE